MLSQERAQAAEGLRRLVGLQCRMAGVVPTAEPREGSAFPTLELSSQPVQ